jgi:hypothetical protein
LLKLLRRLGARVRALPPQLLIALSALLLAAIVAGAIFGYRAYNYVQHDNEFCLSCHLMAEPYERFALSAHRGLGCKACHQPTPVARAKMGLTQVIEQPESLSIHAEVPNERCVECHVNGDRAKWRQIGASAGHRVHLESADPTLQGLTCVECHSSSVHEFAASRKTCGQAGCHQNTPIQLGKMADLTLHCVACHDFSRPVRTDLPRDSILLTLRPRETQCLTCHQMRALVKDLPADEPHGAACGACHNPHVQRTPKEALASCTSCHMRVDTLTPVHRGLNAARLGQCTSCHVAHRFKLDRVDCVSCHQAIFQRESPRVWSAREGNVLQKAAEDQPQRGASTVAVAVQQQEGVRFAHARHRALQCNACHDSSRAHGTLKISSIAQCRDCHHDGSAARPCASCHESGSYLTANYPKQQRFRISARTSQHTRTINFNHEPHKTIVCTQCHTEPNTRSAAAVSCTSCHQQHHAADVSCRLCHVPRQGVHDLRVHMSCSGSGCHTTNPTPGVPRTREFCLLCHQNMLQHKGTANCVTCHVLPAPRAAGAPQ